MHKEYRGAKGAKGKFLIPTTSVVNFAVNLKHEISHAKNTPHENFPLYGKFQNASLKKKPLPFALQQSKLS